jgi:hypothetical protein
LLYGPKVQFFAIELKLRSSPKSFDYKMYQAI